MSSLFLSAAFTPISNSLLVDFFNSWFFIYEFSLFLHRQSGCDQQHSASQGPRRYIPQGLHWRCIKLDARIPHSRIHCFEGAHGLGIIKCGCCCFTTIHSKLQQFSHLPKVWAKLSNRGQLKGSYTVFSFSEGDSLYNGLLWICHIASYMLG